jgi:dGTPase
MFTRREIEEIEIKTLAPYAMKARHAKGRVHKEEEHPYRTCYQRDRDRIIHSTAFRRLEYKTQVFVNHEGDYYRTRLTHTLEVSQIAVSIARGLGLNGDLAEAVALAHDIGHPPFGHSGEEELHVLMKDHGGFDHNLQGLRVVDLLEERYPDFNGLNLSWEVREGINKHSTPYDHSSKLVELEPDKSPTLEAQVVDLSDEIAYDNHDLDDGLTSGLINEAELREIPLWKNIHISRSERPDKEISDHKGPYKYGSDGPYFGIREEDSGA